MLLSVQKARRKKKGYVLTCLYVHKMLLKATFYFLTGSESISGYVMALAIKPVFA